MPLCRSTLRSSPLGCRQAAASALVAVGIVQAGPGWAQSALPPTGLDTGAVGDLRGALQAYLPNPPVRTTERNWQVSPSLGLDIGLTDNAYRINSPRRADVFTLISPAILVTGETAHIQANASYTPTFSIYANSSSQSRSEQFGQAGALITFVPDTLFLDLRASVSESSVTGGFGTPGGQGYNNNNNNNQTTSVTLAATPYVQHRFAGWGTGLLGYSIAQTFQNTPTGQNGVFVTNNANTAGAFGGNQPFYGSTGNLTTQRERASFTTGENFGRINDGVVISATQYNGAGSYSGAYRNEVTSTTGYAITRAITALGTIGYQDLHYGGVPPYNVNQGEYNFGGRYAPNPNLSLTLTYGRKDGFNAFAADGHWSPGARTSIYVRYNTGLTTDTEQLQDVLATTNVGPNGLLTDRVTGAPVSSGSGGFFGTQNNLYQLRSLSITGVYSLDRDSFTASVVNEDRTAVGAAISSTGNGVVPPGTSTIGTFGTVSWGHQLSDRLTSTASLSYGVNNNGAALGIGSASQTSIAASASLNYTFTPTVTGRALYSYTNVSGPSAFNTLNNNQLGNGFGQTGNYTENAFLVGLRKSF